MSDAMGPGHGSYRPARERTLFDDVRAFWEEEFDRDAHENGHVADVEWRRFEERESDDGYLARCWTFAIVRVYPHNLKLEVRACGDNWDESALSMMAEMSKLQILVEDMRKYNPWMMASVERFPNATEKT